MVRINPEGDKFVFTIEGLHKLWALRSRLEIPRAHVRGARRDPSAFHESKGWRAPGTNIPGLFTAGTFHLHGDRIFWDVRHPAKAIVVELHDERYRELIIEVEDPDAAMALLSPNQ
ncbi:MAG TPA: hypothetical protein VF022_05165 [Rhodanobacteraceae bacterium]|jgi:hypothetical protein